jgi:hypothetical protein
MAILPSENPRILRWQDHDDIGIILIAISGVIPEWAILELAQ